MLKRILLTAPIELPALVLLPLTLSCGLFFFSDLTIAHFASNSLDPENYSYYTFFLFLIPPFIKPILLFVVAYGFIRALWWYVKAFLKFTKWSPNKTERTTKDQLHTFRTYLGSLLFALSALMAFGSILVIIMQYIGMADPATVSETGQKLLGWDQSIFGVYLPFWLQGNSWSAAMDYITVTAYMMLIPVLTIAVIGLLLAGRYNKLRVFMISFALAPLLALPIWHTYPALTPNEMYRLNILDLDEQDPTIAYTQAKSAEIGGTTSYLLDSIEYQMSQPEEGHYHVPTFPSMHAAWATILLYCGFVISFPVGLFFLAWWIANAIGAVMSLQHYGVDIILGTILGAVAILIAEYLLRVEEKHHSVSQAYYALFSPLVSDLKQLHTKLRSTSTRLSLFLRSKVFHDTI